MAGIYIHIPFCKVKCHYCDFHFSTQLKNKSSVVNAIKQEIELQSNFLSGLEVNTVYFGGGTPSVLDQNELAEIIKVLRDQNDIKSDAEITLECNPDDLNPAKLKELKAEGINRLSIGTQSFDDDVLKFMNRAHSASEAIDSIKWSKDEGFENITLDLIYGIPEKDMNYWKNGQILGINI